jgi:hypothetical protein
MIYQLKHFIPQEFLDPQTFAKWGLTGLRYMDQGLLAAMDWIWENYPVPAIGKRSIHVNTYAFGGPHRWRGLRLPGSEYFREYSAHASGRAVDFVPEGISIAEMQAWIGHRHRLATEAVQEAKSEMEYWPDHPILAIRRMEALADTPGWVHIDCLPCEGDNLQIIRKSA